LITVSIVAIMASMVLFALFAAQEQAKVQKTRALIVRLDSIIRERYDSYRTRRVPIKVPANTPISDAARMRLDVLRDLMRMEMPDRWSDVYDPPATPFLPVGGTKISWPSVYQAYRGKYATVTGQPIAMLTRVPGLEEHQGAECLYMIVMEALAQEGDARETFKPDDVGDVDGDGLPEFIDAWGTPIRFLRWAPGFLSELQQVAQFTPDSVNPSGSSVTFTISDDTKIKKLSREISRYLAGAVGVLDANDRIIGNRTAKITAYKYDDNGTPNDLTDDIATFTCDTVNGVQPFAPGGEPNTTETIVLMGPDPFDPRGVYPNTINPPDTLSFTFGLHPLIYSAGSNKCFGIRTEPPTDPLRYKDHRLNPFYSEGGELIGEANDFTAEQNFVTRGWTDNIHNHQLNLR
jgi:hypothetical protein